MSKILDELQKSNGIFIDPCPQTRTSKLFSRIIRRVGSILSDNKIFLIKKVDISRSAVSKLNSDSLNSLSYEVKDQKWLQGLLLDNPDKLSSIAKEYYIVFESSCEVLGTSSRG